MDENYVEHHERIHELEDKARKLQALEYERRLNELNHAHERAQEDKAQFVNLQAYSSEQQDIRAQLNKINNDANAALNLSASTSKDVASMQATLSWLSRTIIGSLVVAGLALLIRVFGG